MTDQTKAPQRPSRSHQENNMTRDEQLIKAALDMAAETAGAQMAKITGTPYAAGGRVFAAAIRAIDPADVLAKVGATNTNLEPPRLMAMCGHCRSAGEEYCVQYLTDLRWDGAEWCCKDCFDGSGENGDWDEATQPCPQPAPDREALVRLLQAITRNGSLDDGRTVHEVIADALLAAGWQWGTNAHDHN